MSPTTRERWGRTSRGRKIGKKTNGDSRLARERARVGKEEELAELKEIGTHQQQQAANTPDSRVSEDGLGGGGNRQRNYSRLAREQGRAAGRMSRTKTTTTASFPDFARERGTGSKQEGGRDWMEGYGLSGGWRFRMGLWLRVSGKGA